MCFIIKGAYICDMVYAYTNWREETKNFVSPVREKHFFAWVRVVIMLFIAGQGIGNTNIIQSFYGIVYT